MLLQKQYRPNSVVYCTLRIHNSRDYEGAPNQSQQTDKLAAVSEPGLCPEPRSAAIAAVAGVRCIYMKNNIDLWGVFHDGSVVEVAGSLPSVRMEIEIEYLRNMFPVKGKAFIATLVGCELIEFYDWDSDTVIHDISVISSKEPEILNVKEVDGAAHITCATGVLKLKYRDIQFMLDTGESVTYEELDGACSKYWEDWQSRANI